MMFPDRCTLSLVFVSAIALVCSSPHPPTTTPGSPVSQQYYDSRFDSIDLDEVLRSERLLKNYIKCLENLGPCTADARMLKEILPDAAVTDCMRCTEKQKEGANKVTNFLIDNRPEDWERLEKIYDPTASYRTKYLAGKTMQAEAKTEKN